jgi:hypothetical protein
MEKILERLMNNSIFYFLDGYLGYSQFAIQPKVNLGDSNLLSLSLLLLMLIT